MFRNSLDIYECYVFIKRRPSKGSRISRARPPHCYTGFKEANVEFCVWMAVSSHSSQHPQEVLLAQFSLYVHEGGIKPHSFIHFLNTILICTMHVFGSYNRPCIFPSNTIFFNIYINHHCDVYYPLTAGADYIRFLHFY